MGAKSLCCGGTSGGGGSGGTGGLTAVSVADTPTVDLSGAGTPANPITATAIVAPEPNGLEAGATGLSVAPSGVAGNTLVVAADGRLYVPNSGGGGGLTAVAIADTTSVDLSGDGTAGSPITATAIVAPEPNGLEIVAGGLLVAPSTAAGNALTVNPDGRLYVAAPSAPVWGNSATANYNWDPGDPFGLQPLQTFTAPADGVYDVDFVVTGTVDSGEATVPDWNAGMVVQTDLTGAQEFWLAAGATTQNSTPERVRAFGTTTVTRREQLTAGQVVTGYLELISPFIPSDPGMAQANFTAQGYWSWHRIA